MGKWRVFALREPSSLFWGMGVCFSIYFVQDSCLVPQLVPRPHYYSARPERLGSRGPNEDPVKTSCTWYKPRTSKHGGEVGGSVRIQIHPLKGKRTIKKGA